MLYSYGGFSRGRLSGISLEGQKVKGTDKHTLEGRKIPNSFTILQAVLRTKNGAPLSCNNDENIVSRVYDKMFTSS